MWRAALRLLLGLVVVIFAAAGAWAQYKGIILIIMGDDISY